MLNLYSDKSQKFECTVEISGNTSKNTECRLIFIPDNDNKKIFFEGKIEKNKCWVEIPPLKEINKTGNIKLEIIIDNSIFSPWNSNYSITEQLKVESVKIYDTNTKIVVNNSNITNNTIDIKNIKTNNKTLAKNYIQEYKNMESTDKKFITEFVTTYFEPKKTTLNWASKIFKDINKQIPKIVMYLYENKKKI